MFLQFSVPTDLSHIKVESSSKYHLKVSAGTEVVL